MVPEEREDSEERKKLTQPTKKIFQKTFIPREFKEFKEKESDETGLQQFGMINWKQRRLEKFDWTYEDCKEGGQGNRVLGDF